MSAFRRVQAVRVARTAGIAVLCSALVPTSCTKSEDAGNQSTPGTGGAQVAEDGADGSTCILEQYGGTELDLKDAVIGFSQSEKEANPFRIAEIESIRAEALGVGQLLTTNANSQLSKQISDIQDMINHVAQALIVAPLNSDGLEPALAAPGSDSPLWPSAAAARPPHSWVFPLPAT